MPKIYDVLSMPWAVKESKLLEIQEIYRVHFRGEKIDMKGIEARVLAAMDNKKGGGAENPGYETINGVAVIPIEGVITKNLDFFSWLFGGTSTKEIGAAFMNALNDPQVKSICFCVDSPGGTVDGTQELANLIFENRGDKPIVGFSDGMVASAAYWIFSAMDQRYISGDTVEVGSIGVVASHVDISKMEDMRGIKVTEITAGKFKRMASAHAPLSDPGRSMIQDQVDHLYSIMVGDIARNLGTSEDNVLKNMADGKIFFGKQALAAGMVDGVSTMDRLINKFGNVTPQSIRAMVEDRVKNLRMEG